MVSYLSVRPRQRLSRLGLALRTRKTGLGLPPARGLGSSSDWDLGRQGCGKRKLAFRALQQPASRHVITRVTGNARWPQERASDSQVRNMRRKLSEIRQCGDNDISRRQPEEENSAPNQTRRHSNPHASCPARGRVEPFPGASRTEDCFRMMDSEAPLALALSVLRHPNNKHGKRYQIIAMGVAAGRQSCPKGTLVSEAMKRKGRRNGGLPSPSKTRFVLVLPLLQ